MKPCTITAPCLLLVVDDHESMRRVFFAAKDMFLDKGLDVVIADSLRQALLFLSQMSIMVVLVDLNLPGESEGADTIKRIARKNGPPVFGFSGAANSELRGLCIEYGAKDLFLKTTIQLPALAGILKTAASTYRNSLEIRQDFNALLGQ